MRVRILGGLSSRRADQRAIFPDEQSRALLICCAVGITGSGTVWLSQVLVSSVAGFRLSGAVLGVELFLHI